MKILVGFILINLWTCRAFSQVTGITIVDGKYKIDTATILANKNLSPLIDDLNKSDLNEKKTVQEIPGFIKTFLNKLTGNFSIANPGENWNATDVTDERLPFRQFVYFGVGKDIALFSYYSGGIGESEHILIIKFKENNIVDFWCGNILEKEVSNKEGILNFIGENKDKHWGLNTNWIHI